MPLPALPIAGLLLLVTLRVATPYAAVAALTAAFFMVEIIEGAFGAAIMNVGRSDVAAAWRVLNTGGNAGGVWGGAFITGTVFAPAAAGADSILSRTCFSTLRSLAGQIALVAADGLAVIGLQFLEYQGRDDGPGAEHGSARWMP